MPLGYLVPPNLSGGTFVSKGAKLDFGWRVFPGESPWQRQGGNPTKKGINRREKTKKVTKMWLFFGKILGKSGRFFEKMAYYQGFAKAARAGLALAQNVLLISCILEARPFHR
jgi:hypothetical protein